MLIPEDERTMTKEQLARYGFVVCLCASRCSAMSGTDAAYGHQRRGAAASGRQEVRGGLASIKAIQVELGIPDYNPGSHQPTAADSLLGHAADTRFVVLTARMLLPDQQALAFSGGRSPICLRARYA
eukprot:1090415-Rhodomonas_salina.1